MFLLLEVGGRDYLQSGGAAVPGRVLLAAIGLGINDVQLRLSV